MDNKTDIRLLTEDHLVLAMQLVRDVFMQFEAPDYSERGIAEFMDFADPRFMKNMMKNGDILVWGCFVHDKLIGVSALRPPNHISLLFVDAACHRHGIARTLVNQMEAHARRAGSTSIDVHSSPYARVAYEHMGFCATGPEQTENGLRFIPMKKDL